MLETISVHAQNSICLKGSYTIYIDPFHVIEESTKADFILITHPHWDHFSLIDILKVRTETTKYFVIREVFEELLNIGIKEEQIKIVKPNETYHFDFLEIKTIPAYNTNSEYHKKENLWVGYLINLDQVIYYIAGDTDIIEEQNELFADIMFLPIGGNFTMDEIESAAFANEHHPKLVIPVHYGINSGTLKSPNYFKKNLKKDIACKIYFTGESEE